MFRIINSNAETKLTTPTPPKKKNPLDFYSGAGVGADGLASPTVLAPSANHTRTCHIPSCFNQRKQPLCTITLLIPRCPRNR